jgi:MFS family permease
MRAGSLVPFFISSFSVEYSKSILRIRRSSPRGVQIFVSDASRMSSLGLRGNSLNVMAILGVLMPGIMSIGYNAASLGGVLSLRSFERQFPEIDVDNAKDRSYASSIQGTVVAVYAVGGFLGTFSCIWLGDRLGRRWTMMVGSLVQIVGSILSASACTLIQLIVSRVTIGVGTGALLATIPLWQSEISPAKKRGTHVATKGIFSGLGCALALFLEFGMSFMGNSVAWRFPAAFPILLATIVFVFAALLPDSPRWLLRQGRVTEARQVLAMLENTCVNDSIIEEKVKEVHVSLDLAGGKRSLGQIFHMGPQRVFHRALLAAGPLLFLQLTGATVTTFYSKSSHFQTELNVLSNGDFSSNRHLREEPITR